VFNIHNGPGSVLNSFGHDFKGPSSINLAGMQAPPTNYADGPESVSNLAVPMTPLHATDSVRDHQQVLWIKFKLKSKQFQHPPSSNLAASNIPMVIPQTPYNAPMEVPSPTLQNIVSTVNLGKLLIFNKSN